MTDEQKHILQHALGLTRGGREYRNLFVTGPGSTDYADCEELVCLGLMTKRPGHALSGGDPVYTVTEAGKIAARLKPPNVGAPFERLVRPLVP